MTEPVEVVKPVKLSNAQKFEYLLGALHNRPRQVPSPRLLGLLLGGLVGMVLFLWLQVMLLQYRVKVLEKAAPVEVRQGP